MWTALFLSYALSNWQVQIVTDTCKNNVSKFFWRPFKSPLSIRKWKCFGEVSLFNLHHLYFNYHLLAEKLFCLWKVLPFLQALNHSGSFGKNFDKLKKKDKHVIYRLRVGPYGENWLGLGQHFSRPRSQFFTIRTSQPENNIYNIRDSDALFPIGWTIIWPEIEWQHSFRR